MADNKYLNKGDGNYYEELNLDNLDEVSGGRIKLKGYAALEGLMWQMKRLGKDKEYCIEAVRNGWYQDSPYKTDFTDGTDEDLEKTLAYIEKNW